MFAIGFLLFALSYHTVVTTRTKDVVVSLNNTASKKNIKMSSLRDLFMFVFKFGTSVLPKFRDLFLSS